MKAILYKDRIIVLENVREVSIFDNKTIYIYYTDGGCVSLNTSRKPEDMSVRELLQEIYNILTTK